MRSQVPLLASPCLSVPDTSTSSGKNPEIANQISRGGKTIDRDHLGNQRRCGLRTNSGDRLNSLVSSFRNLIKSLLNEFFKYLMIGKFTPDLLDFLPHQLLSNRARARSSGIFRSRMQLRSHFFRDPCNLFHGFESGAREFVGSGILFQQEQGPFAPRAWER